MFNCIPHYALVHHAHLSDQVMSGAEMQICFYSLPSIVLLHLINVKKMCKKIMFKGFRYK